MRHWWLAWLVCFGVTPACGASSDDDSGSGANAGTGGTTPLEPAPNVDVTSCAAILEDPGGGFEALDRCSDCCNPGAGRRASSFINRGQCTCAEPREGDEGATICADATADGDTCSACCQDHHFSTSGWIGTDGTNPARCACQSLRDPDICAAAARSESACDDCCVHEGFIARLYGSGTCTCIAP